MQDQAEKAKLKIGDESLLASIIDKPPHPHAPFFAK